MFHIGDMSTFQTKVKPEGPDVKWHQSKVLTVFTVITFQSDDQLSPEVVGLGVFALPDSKAGPGFDCETCSGANVVVGTSVDHLETFQELMGCFAAQGPFAKLVPIQAQHFPYVPQPFDMGSAV